MLFSFFFYKRTDAQGPSRSRFKIFHLLRAVVDAGCLCVRPSITGRTQWRPSDFGATKRSKPENWGCVDPVVTVVGMR